MHHLTEEEEQEGEGEEDGEEEKEEGEKEERRKAARRFRATDVRIHFSLFPSPKPSLSHQSTFLDLIIPTLHNEL